jgi:enoyl-[acyl-carrier protein] reductase II
VDANSIGRALLADVRAGGGHDRLPFTGQSAGLIHDIAPAAEIMRRLLEETETALRSAQAMASG